MRKARRTTVLSALTLSLSLSHTDHRQQAERVGLHSAADTGGEEEHEAYTLPVQAHSCYAETLWILAEFPFT